MNSRIVSFLVLLTFLFGSCIAGTSSIQVHISGTSSKWWIAAAPTNDGSATVGFEVKSSGSLEWVPGTFNGGWGYYGLQPTDGNGFVLPLSFRFTNTDGSKVIATDIMTTFVNEGWIDTGVQYGAAAPAATAAPTAKATAAPPPTQATQKPITVTPAPTAAPTVKATAAPAATPAPTAKATAAPVATPAPTAKATAAPVATPAPTAKPTPAPTASADLCSDVGKTVEPVKMMVPLYVYPGDAWDQLLTIAATGVKIVAIINPNSGPNVAGPDSAYKSYMQKFANAGIEMIGYVHTSWGARNVTAVLNDIDTWQTMYTGSSAINGIFFDEGATEVAQIPYYRTIYNAVMAKKWKHVVLNPGAQPAAGYMNVSTTIVIFENYATELYNTRFDSWVMCAPNAAAQPTHKYRFSSIIHTAKLSDMQWLVSQSYIRGMGYVYVTDYEGGCCTYNWLNTYFNTQGNYVKQLNSQ